MSQRVTLLGQAFVLLGASVLGFGLMVLWSLGLALVPQSAVVVRWFADRHRAWAGARLGEPVERPYAPGKILADPATWRDWAWLAVNSVTAWLTAGLSVLLFGLGVFYLVYPLIFALTPPQVFRAPFGPVLPLTGVRESFVMLPVGLVVLLAWYLTAPGLADLDARIMRSFLAPTESGRLRARVAELASSRNETVDAQASELRRIERDLHDGAQARLASLGMSLGLAEQLWASDPDTARKLVVEARESTTRALGELRELVRGIHPPLLADRGLGGAIEALALMNPIPTSVVVDLPGRPSAPVESAAYFATAEALANAIKHAQAHHISIHAKQDAGTLEIRVRDDGRGGAGFEKGTGLRGAERRLAAFDGTLVVDSPVGGPTEVRMSLPCVLS